MDSPFTETIAEEVARAGIRIARFEFPYMRRQRRRGTCPQSQAVFRGIASMIADETSMRGLARLGYPFHPPGKPEQTRTR